MKHAFLVLAVTFTTITAPAQSRYVTVKIDAIPVNGVPQTNEIAIATGEIGELVSFPHYGYAWLDVIKDGATFSFNNPTADSLAAAKSLIIAGPTTFKLRSFAGGSAGLCTVKITPESFPPDKTVIIPDGTTGATITLECSTNLINWTTATNGFYTGTSSAKFFRIRAERAP